MKPGKKTLLAAAFSALALLGAWIFVRSEADRIRERFDKAAELLRREADDTSMEVLAKAEKLSGFMVPEGFTIGVKDHGSVKFGSRGDATRMILAVTEGSNAAIRISFGDLEIITEGSEAFVKGTVDCSGSDPSFALPPPLKRAFSARLVKEDGEWLFSTIAVE
ncbi:MAG: hypothetical protein K6F50_04010 [Kiritimatiellae bacterium]|nr:hypothetical protein [Kiritimatiellia bacterium]